LITGYLCSNSTDKNSNMSTRLFTVKIMTNAAHLALFELLYEHVVFAQVKLENLQKTIEN